MRNTLIGKTITIVDSSNQSLKNLEGKVIDETKNTIKITDKKNSEKTLIKNQITFKVSNSDIVVDGKKLSKRIEERIKK